MDSSILAFFRIAFGVSMLWHLVSFQAAGRIGSELVNPGFHFTYPGFGWIRPLPGAGMYWVFGILSVASFGLIAGWRHRLQAGILAIGFTYLFLIERTNYLNHAYLMGIFVWMTLLLPVNACWSVDAWLNPLILRRTVPGWTLWLLRFQMAVVYFYGGVAKLNADWLRGEPMREWLLERAEWWGVGSFFQMAAAPFLFSYGGLLFDLLIVPALLWRRTRILAFVAAAGFHLINSQLFQIGVFPWMAIALTALFFDPSLPRRAMDHLGRWYQGFQRGDRIAEPSLAHPAPKPMSKGLVIAIGIFGMGQVVLPLRHMFYPGNVNWTEQGHEFAWHMMLRSKKLEAAGFYVVNRGTGNAWLLDPMVYLTPRQFDKMIKHPQMVRQFCNHIASLMQQRGYPEAEVRAVVYLRLNSHPPALLVDPAIDLGAARSSLGNDEWILPLEPQLASKEAQHGICTVSADSPTAAHYAP